MKILPQIHISETNSSRLPNYAVCSLKIVCIIALFAVFYLICGCAKVGPPPGGMVDRIGPKIVQVSPQDGAVGVPLNTKITFYIDEWFNRDSFSKAFFISPEPSGKVKYKYGLHKITVDFKEGLQEDRTYVVTIGTGFKDLLGNPLEESYTFAFSTGYKFDYGVISGRVFDTNKSGMIAALYRMGNQVDYLNEKGEYLTQTDKEGNFTFSYLPPAEYRLLIFNDTDNDRLYNPENEELALAWSDFSVNEDTSHLVLMKSKMRHPYPPLMNSINPRHNQELEIILDRPLEILPPIEGITLVDTTTITPLKVHTIYRHIIDSTRIVLQTEPVDTIDYRLSLRGGLDFEGMVMDDSIVFKGISTPDTLPPSVLRYSAQADTLSAVIDLKCSEQVDINELTRGFSFPDSLRIPPIFKVENPRPGAFILTSTDFSFNDTLFFNLRYLQDLKQNTAKDSILYLLVEKITAETPAEDLGVISGMVEYDADTPIIVILKAGNNEISRQILTNEKGFEFTEIPAGFYTFEAFIDTDGNRRYDYGLLEPFRFPERFTVVQDSFRVRSGWETSGVKIVFE